MIEIGEKLKTRRRLGEIGESRQAMELEQTRDELKQKETSASSGVRNM